MTPTVKVSAALKCEPLDREGAPVTPHWWGLYKFAHAGIIGHGYDGSERAWGLRGKELADVDSKFYEDFKPDIFHLTAGAPRRPLLGRFHSQGEWDRLFVALRRLESRAATDEYIAAVYLDEEATLANGEFEHISLLAERYPDVPLFLNEGNPISDILDPHGSVGFEEGLVALLEKPDEMIYLIEKSYESLLPRLRALKRAAGDSFVGYIGSETYCGTDIMSPRMWRELIYPAQKRFYTAAAAMGVASVCYFLGDVKPILEDIKDMGIHGLMVEEGKKTFALDIGEIYAALERSVCLFGNLDSVYILQMGTPQDVARETRRQMKACAAGGFIMANGCPLSFGTHPENVRAMIQTARGMARDD